MSRFERFFHINTVRQSKFLKLILLLLICAAAPRYVQSQTLNPDGLVAWRPDGNMLAVARGTTVEIIDAVDMTVLNTLDNFVDFSAYRGEIAWSPDGTMLAITNGGDVEVWENPWNPTNSQPITVYQYYSEYNPPVFDVSVRAIAWSPDGGLIASAAGIGVDIWRVADGSTESVIISPGDNIEDLDWSTDNRLAISGLDRFVTIFDPISGNPLNSFYTASRPTLPPGIWAIAFSPDERQIAVGIGDGHLRIWGDTLSSEPLTETAAFESYDHTENIFSLSWNADGQLLASGSEDGTIRVWDTASWSQVQVINVGVPVASVEWSPISNTLAYVGPNGAVVLTEVEAQNPTPTATETITPTLTETPTTTETATPTPPAAPTFTPTLAPPTLITDISVANGKGYTRDSVSVNNTLYIDRTYTFVTVPTQFLGQDYIRTANADKTLTTANFLTFTLTADARVYVAFDTRYPRPAWLATWTDSGQQIVATEQGGITLARQLFYRDFPAGPVTLPGNASPNASVMYTVIAVPNTLPATPNRD